MILEASEKISTKSSRCTMFALGSPEKALSVSANLQQAKLAGSCQVLVKLM